jgi:hypothetical protein
MTRAYVVPRGKKSVRLLVSNVDRDCAWAIKNGIERYEKGELRGTFDLAPVHAPGGGTSWQIVRGGFAGDPTSGWSNTTNGEARQWPADVTRSGTRCPRHIAVTAKQLPVDSPNERRTALEIDADFDPVCCSNDPEPSTGTMAARIGSDVYPLGRAGRMTSGGIRITRVSDPCDADDEDVVIIVSPERPLRSVSVFGNVLPRAKVVNQNVTVEDEPSGRKLRLHGSVDLATVVADSATLHVEIDGEVPVARCRD